MSRWISLGIALAIGSIGTPSLAQESELATMAADCNAGKGFECKRLGNRLEWGLYGPADLQKARAAYDRGCTLKDSVSCALLYKMLALGEGGPQDLKRAKPLEAQACNHPYLSVTSTLKGSGLCKK